MDKSADFLARFVGRGWLHATRDDPAEQAAVDLGLRKRWLRRELGEAHFTPKGREAIASSGDRPIGSSERQLAEGHATWDTPTPPRIAGRET